MLIFLLITTITFIITFLLNPISKKAAKKLKGNRQPKFHIHHSVTGLAICGVGVIIGSNFIAGLGLGIYLAHVAEEVYFNKKKVVKAFFILVTPVPPHNK